MKEDSLDSYLNYSHKVESRWWLSGDKHSELTQLPHPGRVDQKMCKLWPEKRRSWIDDSGEEYGYGSHKGVDLNNCENGELTVDERQQQENPQDPPGSILQ